MSSKVPSEDVAAKVSALMADVDALDHGVIEAGLTASRALARAEALEAVLRAAVYDDAAPDGPETYTDAVTAGIEARRRKVEARRRRIAASGFTLIAGGAS